VIAVWRGAPTRFMAFEIFATGAAFARECACNSFSCAFVQARTRMRLVTQVGHAAPHGPGGRAGLWYLPIYSLDLNPIEQAFAKIKHWMRSAQKRTLEDTWRHVGALVATIKPHECNNYLRQCWLRFRQNVNRLGANSPAAWRPLRNSPKNRAGRTPRQSCRARTPNSFTVIIYCHVKSANAENL
jgi:hypothetical protein